MTPYLDGDGFEPSKQFAADLQSVPFGHSGIRPCLFIDQLSIPRFSGKCKDFFHFVIFATNSLGFTVSSAQAGRNPLLIAFRADFIFDQAQQ